MAHDDHFETVNIAYSWHTDGLFLEDGTLRWEGKPEGGILRPATYNLFLLGLMKLTSAVGIDELHSHMYFNRLIHALLSLLPVIFGYRYLKETTSEASATWGGLLLAAYFLMPFLGVRNLVEMVSADLLIPGLYYAHRSLRVDESGESHRDAVLAGILCGLAVVVRYQTAAAAVAIPIAMVIAERRWRAAYWFCGSAVLVIFLQALLDVYTHGYFFGSFINVITATGPTAVAGPWYRYILLMLGILIPPTSLLLVLSLFQREVIRKHIILWLPLISFVVIHSVITEKQERFLIPILPVLLILVVAGLHYLYSSAGWYRKRPWIGRVLLIWFAAVNLIALPVFTVNYGRRGLVESMVYLSDQPDADRVLFLSPERHTFFPFSYWSPDRSGATVIQSREALHRLVSSDSSAPTLPRYAMIVTDDSLDVYLDLLSDQYEPVFHAGPSLVDLIANKLNPKYNRRNESWVLRR